ncbi:MAG TPA: TonB-dependent receptor, partial [Nevskiaceae bacterium]|nr:TonB-dependent receptor [Nevskiaceae bacterium]
PFNPTNPQSPYYIPGTTAQDIGRADAAAGLVGLGAVLRRMTELGPRLFTQAVDTLNITGGFDGNYDLLGTFAGWDAGFSFGESRQVDENAGLLDMTRVSRALGPLSNCVDTVAPDGTTIPAPPGANGCVPLDIFGGPGTITPEMLDYISYTALDRARARQWYFYASTNTSIPTSGVLAGDLGVAVGGEFRRNFYEGQPDPLKINGTSSTNSATASRGAYSVTEFFAEVSAPLVRDLPYAQSVNLSLAGRYSEYDILDRTFDKPVGKIGLEWRVVDDLMLRSTYSQAFRAPSITDLFLGAATSFPEVTDPCSAPEPGSNAETNCTADGVNGVDQTNSQIPTIFGGNTELDPETATSFSAGLVFSPTFIPGLDRFNMTVDYFDIDLEDFISFVGTGQIFALCYDADPNNRALCENVNRNPGNGQISSIDNTATNFLGLRTSGIDTNIDWVLPVLRDYGSLKFQLDSSYVLTYEQTTPTTTGPVTFGFVGVNTGTGGIPRVKINTTLEFATGPFTASWNTRYIHSMFEICDDGFGDPGAAEGGGNPTPILTLDQYGLCSGPDTENFGLINKLEAVLYHDFVFGYDLPALGTNLTLGVINALDKDPPRIGTAFASSYDPTIYDYKGSRTVYLKFIKSF